MNEKRRHRHTMNSAAATKPVTMAHTHIHTHTNVKQKPFFSLRQCVCLFYSPLISVCYTVLLFLHTTLTLCCGIFQAKFPQKRERQCCMGDDLKLTWIRERRTHLRTGSKSKFTVSNLPAKKAKEKSVVVN